MKKHHLIVLLALIVSSCGDTGVTPIDGKKEAETWVNLAEFSTFDIRELKTNGNRLYANVVDFSQPDYVGYLFYTEDGGKWKLFFKSKKIFGPIAFKEDTLFCFSDSLYRIAPDGTAKGLFIPTPLDQAPGDFGDMVLFRDALYTMLTLYTDAVTTYRITWDGQVTNVPVHPNFSTYGGARFIKLRSGNDDKVYVRGQYWKQGFYEFDGNLFIPVRNGLNDQEWSNPVTNSVAVKGDILFAAFKYPSRIKYLEGNSWHNYYPDSLPSSKYANHFRPVLTTEFTDMVFAGDRLFAATQCLGVLEWRDTAWVQMSTGLVGATLDFTAPDIDLYTPIPLLTQFKGFLFVGYGEPAAAPWGGKGLFRFRL